MSSRAARADHRQSIVSRLLREPARTAFFRVMRAASRTSDGRVIARETLDDLLTWRPALPSGALECEPPYPDLGRAVHGRTPPNRTPVFITARFRSGSTMLWNLFRHVESCTAYHEPLNERRWFDPSRRGSRVDPTHRHLSDYWREYDNLEELGRYYRADWIDRRLYMDADSWDPDLTAFVRTLLERAPGRPVLQFCRIDFRLAWFRHTFPEATIVHLHRHPRDQWCSSLVDWAECPPACDLAHFPDHFYLKTWAADLRLRFPFLDESRIGHPYQLFYLLWKLSFWFGTAYADYSLSFDAMVRNPAMELRRMFEAVSIEADIPRLCALVDPMPHRWPRYASDAWFRRHEESCEDVLRDFFSTGRPERESAGQPAHEFAGIFPARPAAQDGAVRVAV